MEAKRLPRSRGFWGPNMNALLDKLEEIGFSYQMMAPATLANQLDLYLDIKTDHKARPEIAAKRWLEELNGR